MKKVRHYKIQFFFIVYKRWIKKLLRLVILKLKSVNFITVILLGYVDIDSIQVSSIVSSSKKSQKCFIGYKSCDYKIKPLRIILPKTFANVKTRW